MRMGFRREPTSSVVGTYAPPMTARLVTVAAAVAALGVLASAGAAAGTLPWSSPWGTFTDVSTNTNYGPVTYDRRGRVNASGARVNITVTVVPSSCTPR